MIPNAIAYAMHACQVYGDFVYQAPGHLHPMSSSWPLKMWGMDVIGSISPPTSRGHQFILAITDYFSKWMELSPERSEDTEYDQVHQTSHALPFWCAQMNRP